MRRLLAVTVATATASILLVPSVEASKPTLEEKYSRLYYAVKKKHGTRAPGRNIRRYGIRYDTKANNRRGPWATREAKRHEIARSIRQLRSLLAPARPLLARRAVPPPQDPSGVMSSSQRAPAGGILAAIRQCESGGNYSTNTGNGFYGAYQFTQSTWNSVGGVGNPAAASPAEQDKRAAILYAQQGASPWPVCGR